MNMDEITINNASALLYEVLINGENGMESLYGWFLAEKCFIEKTALHLDELEEDLKSESYDTD